MQPTLHISNWLSAMRRISRIIATTPLCAVVAYIALYIICFAPMSSCRIEPPLKLADRINVTVGFGEVITDIDVIWNTDSDWRKLWWYGWDENDIKRWGEIAYPMPSNYEARFYFFGNTIADSWLDLQKLTVYESTIRRRFDFGYHDMLVWSNIDSHDGTQVLVIDETDQAKIMATTTRSRLSYNLPSRGTLILNSPEVFYSGGLDKFFISQNIEDYDYYDEENNAWVKQLETDLYPLVYIYLVQVAVYNNNGRIVGLSDNATVSSLADGVDIRSGHTSNVPVGICYEMGFKKGLPARDGRLADIFGGKMTTFGLCDMESWSKSRADYDGSRGDLTNHLSLLMHFSNATDSAYHYDITEQMRRQAHGGVITIEIDVDTLGIPKMSSTGSMFDPVIQPADSVEYEFPM